MNRELVTVKLRVIDNRNETVRQEKDNLEMWKRATLEYIQRTVVWASFNHCRVELQSAKEG